MKQSDIVQAVDLLRHKKHVVALTGAGIGRPSGIPDFRSADGLWSQDDPMEVASLHTFQTNPLRFYNWLRPLADLILEAKPNPAHKALADLEQAGMLQAVITQNIDRLHQEAGSRTVYELHGHVKTATCMRCGNQGSTEPLMDYVRQGRMPPCFCGEGGKVKPDIVLFGDLLPKGPLFLSQRAVEMCDALIVVGTALEVNPAASLPLIALQRDVPIIIVNLSETYLDGRAAAIVRDDVAIALPAITQAVLNNTVQ